MKGKRDQNKVELPLIGRDYTWYDERKGIAKTSIKNIDGRNNLSPRVNHWFWFRNKPTQINWYTNPTFVGPGNTYNYRRVDKNQLYNRLPRGEILVRSSYIPYIVGESGNIYWLLGSFHDFPEVKTDFGGACNRSESPEDCSTRELTEETHNVLTGPIIEALNTDRTIVYKGYNKSKSPKHRNKRVFFIMVNMSYHLEDLDRIQDDIRGEKSITGEEFGPLGFYKQSDIYRKRDSETRQPILTNYALTDFVNYKRQENRRR